MPKTISTLTHINKKGQAQMVDVSEKVTTKRVAIAVGKIYMTADTLQKISNNQIAKGDVFSTARIAGVFAAKKTAELIPLCHQLLLSNIEINFEIDSKTRPHVKCTATASTTYGTGVEIEAMSAVSIALLTIYDMAKAIDRFMEISEICLKEKQGGKSGHWQNPKLLVTK